MNWVMEARQQEDLQRRGRGKGRYNFQAVLY